MKTKVLLAALLVAAVPTVSLFASCNKESTDDEKGGSTVNNGELFSNPDDPLSGAHSPNVPEDVRFDGETFSVLIGSTGEVMYAEEETSDLVNDAVYNNNLAVEERFGITMNIVRGGYDATGGGQQEATAQFRSLIEANDQTYHAFMHVQHTGMPQMILERYFVDWNTIPYVNLDEEWWYQNIKNDLCFGDKIYIMTGDYSRYIDRIDCLVFNKDIFDELGLEYPYQAVKDGTWTWDVFADLVARGAKDLNGDGQMSTDDDRYGLSGWGYELAPALLVSSGYSPLSRDADNMPVLNQNVDEAHEIYGKIVDLFSDGKKAVAIWDDYNLSNSLFAEGRSMFKDTFLNGIPGLTDLEFDFGILPYPKWSDDGDYLNRSSNMSPLTYIPVTNPNVEMTGAVLEELAFLGAKNLTPAYFDIVLTVKNTRDTESEDMLPIIKDNARFLYDGYKPDLSGMIQAKSNTYASAYASNLSTYQADLEDMRELLLRED